MALSGPMVVIAMVNGMIGGLILSLPLLSLQGGYGTTAIVLPIIGFFSFYSCYLCVLHLGDQKDLDYAILKHFNNNKYIKIFYDLVVFLNLILILMLYFELIVDQWVQLTSQSIIIPIINAIVLFCLVFVLKYMEFGASVLAYGIISIIGYCIFLIWLLASQPSGTNQPKPWGTGYIDLAAAMGQAYSIQTFFIPVLKQNQFPSNYMKYTALANAIGVSIYLYIAYAGSFGILQRQVNPAIKDPTLIEDYFLNHQWQVMVLSVIYLIHLYSAFPEFLLVSKKRFFSAISLKQTKRGQIPYKQGIYAAIFIIICFIIDIVNVNIDIIIQINGAVIGFFFIYFIPLVLHIKCFYFTKKKQDDSSQMINTRSKSQIPNAQKQVEMENVSVSIQNKSQFRSNTVGLKLVQSNIGNQQDTSSYQTNRTIKNSLINDEQLPQFQVKRLSTQTNMQQMYSGQCTCKAKKPSIPVQIVEVIFCIIMLLIGLLVMVNGIISVINSIKNGNGTSS